MTTPVLEPLFNKAAGLKARNFIKNTGVFLLMLPNL